MRAGLDLNNGEPFLHFQGLGCYLSRFRVAGGGKRL